ncbi:unnamed protein product [Urochloa decumbens]|uniref:DUF1618 domain-containing protein n=1 Tax=Urochloa decumbens TaxID=240449 RepID=A0ABC9BQC3_9POAL
MEVMLDRFVFRRDGGAKPSFPENETTAGADTCIGVPFRVSIDLAAPPAISRFYLEWPRGPKPEAGPRPKPEADPVKQEEKEAADPVPGEEKEAENKSESDSDDSDMAADMVPTKEMEWAERLIRKKHEEEMALGVDVDQGVIVRSSLLVENVGLLCEGDDFVVAELQLAKSIHRVSAELSLFRSNVGQWELKQRLPVDYRNRRDSTGMRRFWPQAVVPFGSSCLCWVDYRRGMILLGDVMEQSPNKLSYVPFPPVPPTGREHMHRGVCATDAGSTLKFVDVVVANKEQRRPCDDNTCTIFTYTLKTMAEGGRMRWEKDTVAPMTAEELWGLEAPLPIPHEVPLFPIVSMEKPQVLHFLLSECTDYIDTVTLVTVDMDTRTVMSVRPYIKGEQELLHGEDADLAEARTSLLQPFLPAHFSNSLDLNTRYMCVVYSC